MAATKETTKAIEEAKGELKSAVANLDKIYLREGTSISIDIEQAFLLYAAFCGDVEKTAHAVGVQPVDILRMVDAGGWTDKLAGIIKLKKSNKAGDIERAINRAMCFVQAHRYRLFLEKLAHKFMRMSDEEIESWIFTSDGKGEKTVKMRPFSDLAAAMEKCHWMSYMALNDSAPERKNRKEEASETESGGQLHAEIAKALAQVRADASPRAQLFNEQLARVNTLTPAKSATTV